MPILPRQIEKVCIWCGKSFMGTTNKIYCDYSCAAECRSIQKQLKDAGKRWSRDQAVAYHKERTVYSTKPKKTIKWVLKPVHTSSAAVQWRYVKER